jgi:hypothetical protein
MYNHNIRNSNLWSIKYNVYADQHRHVTKKTTDWSYVYYDCRGATVEDKGSMAWMPAHIAVSNLCSMISMALIQEGGGHWRRKLNLVVIYKLHGT